MGRKHYLINLIAANRCNNGGTLPTPAECTRLRRKTVAELIEIARGERYAADEAAVARYDADEAYINDPL